MRPPHEQQLSLQQVLSLLGQSCAACNEKYRRRLIRKVKSLARKNEDDTASEKKDRCDDCRHIEESGQCLVGIPASDSYAFDRAKGEDRRGKDPCEWFEALKEPTES